MAYFTDVKSNFSIQRLSMINEIIDSINARLPTGSSFAIDLVEEGDEIQSSFFWSNMQSRLVDMATSFVAIDGKSPWDDYIFSDNTTEVSFGNVKTNTTTGYDSLWNICGLPNKLRRATTYNPLSNDWTDPNDSMFIVPSGSDYGHMRVGDIIGPWVIDDLQKICDALTTKAIECDPVDAKRKYVKSEIKGSLSEAQSEALTLWDDAEIAEGNSGVSAVYSSVEYSINDHEVELLRGSVKYIPRSNDNPSGSVMDAEKNGGQIIYTDQYSLSDKDLVEGFYDGIHFLHSDPITLEPQYTIVSTETFDGDDLSWPKSKMFPNNWDAPSLSPVNPVFVYGYWGGRPLGQSPYQKALLKPIFPYTINRT